MNDDRILGPVGVATSSGFGVIDRGSRRLGSTINRDAF